MSRRTVHKSFKEPLQFLLLRILRREPKTLAQLVIITGRSDSGINTVLRRHKDLFINKDGKWHELQQDAERKAGEPCPKV